MATAVEQAIADDPVAEVVDKHLKKMQEIAELSRDHTQVIAIANISSVRKNALYVHGRFDATLAALGIKDPTS